MNMCNGEHDLTGRSGRLPKDVTLELRPKELFSQGLGQIGKKKKSPGPETL